MNQEIRNKNKGLGSGHGFRVQRHSIRNRNSSTKIGTFTLSKLQGRNKNQRTVVRKLDSRVVFLRYGIVPLADQSKLYFNLFIATLLQTSSVQFNKYSCTQKDQLKKNTSYLIIQLFGPSFPKFCPLELVIKLNSFPIEEVSLWGFGKPPKKLFS